MKKLCIVISILGICILSGIFYYSRTSNQPQKHFNQLKDDLISYEMKGVLEIVDDDALRSIQIQSMYKLIDGNACYYVRLEDSSTHQVQTIVKNQEGVFVLAQGFNRVFQFNSDWPNNSFKPYILDNILELFENDYTIEKIRDGFILTATIIDPIHPTATNTKVLFDQHLNIKQVNLLDEKDNDIFQFEVSTYIINPNIDNSIFTLNSQEEVEVAAYEEIPLYPTNVYENELIDQFQTNQGHILRYKGNDYFTLVQKKMEINDTLHFELCDGEFYVYENGLVYFNQGNAVMVSNGVETTLYSTTLTSDEILNILLSLENKIVIED